MTRLRAAVILVLLAVASTLGGCTGRPARSGAPVESEPYRLESEGRVPPLGPDAIRREVDRVDVFEDLEVVEEGLEVEDVEPVIEVPVEPEPADSAAIVLPGYRVQVFASGIRDNADVVKASVEEALGVTAYVELLDGIYKVRVGDCPNRPQAEALLRRCREAGYGDAWIVASDVTILPAAQ